jgi:hypothetical protein
MLFNIFVELPPSLIVDIIDSGNRPDGILIVCTSVFVSTLPNTVTILYVVI